MKMFFGTSIVSIGLNGHYYFVEGILRDIIAMRRSCAKEAKDIATLVGLDHVRRLYCTDRATML